jgi:hypothetical protein
MKHLTISPPLSNCDANRSKVKIELAKNGASGFVINKTLMISVSLVTFALRMRSSKNSLGMFRVVERFLGNSCYHFVTRISKHTNNQQRAHSVSGSKHLSSQRNL